MKIFDFFKPMTRIKLFVHRQLRQKVPKHHDKNLQIYFSVKRQANKPLSERSRNTVGLGVRAIKVNPGFPVKRPKILPY